MEGGDGTAHDILGSADPIGGMGADMSAGGSLRIVGYVGTSPITSPPSILMRIGGEEIRIPLRDPALHLPGLQDQRSRPAPSREPDPPPARPADDLVPAGAAPAVRPPPHVDVYL